MLDALCEHLLEKPGLCQDEMVLFLLDEFNTQVSTFSIGRALRSIGWTKKQYAAYLRDEMPICETYTYITRQISVRITMFSLMNQAVINGLDLDGPDGLPLA
jgi:hypothetical protein